MNDEQARQIKTLETIARRFHETYERLAPEHGYETREESAKPWEEVPDNNKSLMMAVVAKLLDEGTIKPGSTPVDLGIGSEAETPPDRN